MQKYKSNITTTTGAAIRNVPVTVLTEDGSLASLFLDRAGGVPTPNPLATGADGTFYFYAVNGRYSLRTTVDGVTITDSDVALLMDPEEITVAGPIAEAVAAAEAAALRAETAVEASGIPQLVEAAQNAVVDANQALTAANSAADSAEQARLSANDSKNAAASSQEAATTAAGASASQAAAAADKAREAADKAAEAAASAASIAGGPVASFAGLTGAVTAAQAKTALKLPEDTAADLAAKLGKTETAAASSKLATPRGIKIGSAAAKQFDGSVDVSWTLPEIAGAVNPTEAARAMPLVATQAQANAGADDTAMLTAKKMAAAMISQVADNENIHSIRLPGGFVLVQGSTVTTTNSAGGGALNYPVTFTTKPAVMLTLGDNGVVTDIVAIATQSTAVSTGFQLGPSGSSVTVRVNYFVMGRVA